MTTISATGSASRTTQDDSRDAQIAQQPKPELDASSVRVPHSSADLATFARNLGAEGASIGREKMSSSANTTRAYASVSDAQTAFAAQSKTLLDVNQWNAISGRENATFALCDRSGAPVSGRGASVGDFVRIKLPGQTQSDWVRIEDVTNGPDRVGVRVRPTYDPTKSPLTPNVTAHFFTRESTNTFLLERNGASITARVEGRDESANVASASGGTLSAIRNRAVAEGAWGLQRHAGHVQINGMQQHQWNRFTENLVNKK